YIRTVRSDPQARRSASQRPAGSAPVTPPGIADRYLPTAVDDYTPHPPLFSTRAQRDIAAVGSSPIPSPDKEKSRPALMPQKNTRVSPLSPGFHHAQPCRSRANSRTLPSCPMSNNEYLP